MKKLGFLFLVFGCASGGAAPIAPGRYSGATTAHVGFLQLEVGPEGQAIFRDVITLELPPAEVETHPARLLAKGDRWCLEPAPRAIEPCLVATSSAALTVRTQEGESIVLRR